MDERNNPYISETGKAFVNASFTLSIIGLLTSCCVYTSMVCGSLAIILALLSKGKEEKMHPLAHKGVIIAVISLVIAAVVMIASFASVISHFGSIDGVMEYVQNYYQQYSQNSGTGL